MVALQTIGSNVENLGCPNCGCHDRERHLLLNRTAQRIIDRFKSAAILQFAPEARLSKVIEARCPDRYVKGDLYSTSEDIETIDMLAIDYPAESFDEELLVDVDPRRSGVNENGPFLPFERGGSPGV